MKHWMVVVAIASMVGFGCGASAEDMAGSVRQVKVNKEEPKKPLVKGPIDINNKPKYGGGGPLGAKGDGSGGDPGGDNCSDGYVPCGTGPCCHAATERCGDGKCHARESASGGGSAGDLPETQAPDGGGNNGGIR